MVRLIAFTIDDDRTGGKRKTRGQKKDEGDTTDFKKHKVKATTTAKRAARKK